MTERAAMADRDPRTRAGIVVASTAESRWSWLGRWGLRLIEFGAVQALVQLCGAVAGLLIVRSLTKEDYALFAIANSTLAASNILAELGIGIGFRSIGGRVWTDRDRFGSLLNTALGLRRQFAILSFAMMTPVAGWMLWRNGASVQLVAGLCLCSVAGAIPLLGVSLFSASLQLHSEYRKMQQLDFGSSLLRLGLIAGMAATRINAWLAAFVGVVGNWVQFIIARRWVAALANSAVLPNSDDRGEMIRLSLKALPNAIFFCIQGQVILLILTVFGNPTGIADITAIGRVAMLFAIFSAVFASVLGPRFARCQDPERLPRLYLGLVGMTMLVLLPFVLLAWWWPGPLLWLLGAKYGGLDAECGLVVVAACLGQIGGVMWNMNGSKAWIEVQALGYIPIIVAAQVTVAVFLDLTQFHSVLILNVVTAAAPLPLFAIDAFVGLRRARRQSIHT